MATNIVKFGNNTIIDLTNATATASDIAEGKTAYGRDGNLITGTASGGGGMNVQVYSGIDYVRASSYSDTDVTVTVKTTGTYNISWMGWRNTTSGTSGSRAYINGTAIGTAHTTFTSSYGQYCEETNIQLDAGDVVVIRARARNSSYYMYVGNLIIEQTS